jgi:hypothetical protein
MKMLAKRLLRLEVGHAAHTNAHGLTPADVFRQRMCRRQAQETGRPYAELLRESVRDPVSRAGWNAGVACNTGGQ